MDLKRTNTIEEGEDKNRTCLCKGGKKIFSISYLDFKYLERKNSSKLNNQRNHLFGGKKYAM